MTYPHTATVVRQVKSGTKYTYQDVDETHCFLQPLSNEETLTFGITATQAYQCYLPIDSGVKDKDRLKIDGDTYGVKGVKSHKYGRLTHKRAILELV
jgi:hypothetical protein